MKVQLGNHFISIDEGREVNGVKFNTTYALVLKGNKLYCFKSYLKSLHTKLNTQIEARIKCFTTEEECYTITDTFDNQTYTVIGTISEPIELGGFGTFEEPKEAKQEPKEVSKPQAIVAELLQK